MTSSTTLEWFGTTTYRLRSKGVTILLDTWLERPSALPKFITLDSVQELDYIFISHAHFDHLPGADRLAIRTGAIVIANCEAINLLRKSGVPEAQLLPVYGGERIPLFTRAVRDQATRGEIPTSSRLPGQPLVPDHQFAALAVHVWPSLHAYIPIPHPEFIDTRTVYTGEAHPYVCTLDITHGMKYGLLNLEKIVPPEKIDHRMRSFIDYVNDKQNLFSHCDGGQLMFNIIINNKALLWSSHLGGYDGVLAAVEPKPTVAILGIAGRANLNGRPFDGSAAEFALKELKLLGEPEKVVWCMHDESCTAPYYVDTTGATELVEKETRSRVWDLVPAKSYTLDL